MYRLALALLVTLAVTACSPQDDHASGSAGATSSTTGSEESTQALSDFVALYEADVPGYWSTFGLPPLSRLADLLERHGGDPLSAFDGLAPAFMQADFESALASGDLPSDFAVRYSAAIQTAAAPWTAWVLATRDIVHELDVARGPTPPESPRATEIRSTLAAVFQLSFDPAIVAQVAPETFVKTNVSVPGPDFLGNPWPPSVIPGNPEYVTNWDDITPNAWPVDHNPACVGVALGACARKLGILCNDRVTCPCWDKLGQELNADKTGAPEISIRDWFRAHGGYELTEATGGTYVQGGNTISESPCQQARSALLRGCDVLLSFVGKEAGQTHIEFVTGMTDAVGPMGETCGVTTLSWGQELDVILSIVSVTKLDGSSAMQLQFSGKQNPVSPWLGDTGKAILRYTCPKETTSSWFDLCSEGCSERAQPCTSTPDCCCGAGRCDETSQTPICCRDAQQSCIPALNECCTGRTDPATGDTMDKYTCHVTGASDTGVCCYVVGHKCERPGQCCDGAECLPQPGVGKLCVAP